MENNHLLVYSLDVISDLGEAVTKLVGVEVTEDGMVLALSLGAGQQGLPARVCGEAWPQLPSDQTYSF